MGEVYKARDVRLDRTVAIKVSCQQFSERFEREARAIASLNHPHVCQLYDVGPNHLVMELVEGRALEGPLPAAKALEYVLKVCDALDAAHRKGVAHGDRRSGVLRRSRRGTAIRHAGERSGRPAGDRDPELDRGAEEKVTILRQGRRLFGCWPLKGA
jgi:tRNA A-37 threonylcarbamoyl transferase component Bud32